jgi:hypothetical protein
MAAAGLLYQRGAWLAWAGAAALACLGAVLALRLMPAKSAIAGAADRMPSSPP